jgi:glycosyltransferase involved in cell wall biosynthesis
VKIVQLTTDDRESIRDYSNPTPCFGAAPTALLEGFARTPDVEVHVISCAQSPMSSPAKLADNIWFHSLHVPKSGWLRTGYQGCIRAVRRKIKQIQPDIGHGQGSERDCALEAVFSGFPNVVTLHGVMMQQAKLLKARPFSFYWSGAQLEKFTLPRTAGVFCNSEYTENAIRDFSRKRWRVPNAVRDAFFQRPAVAASPAKPILLNVGAISRRKQQCALLQAARELHESGLDFELHFLGALHSSTDYNRQFLDGVAQNSRFVRHLGFKPLDEIIRAYDAASAVIHVPSEEAFGLVVAEGLARNLKFFGFDVGGIPEIAKGVEGAELLPVGDWNGLKESVRRWINDGSPTPVSAATMMRERYHPGIIAARHVEIYREVLNNSS